MMTLLEMKKKVLRLIEEINESDTILTDDPDIKAKLNDVINQVQFEVARMKKIPARYIKQIGKDEFTMDMKKIPGFYQLEFIKFANEQGEQKGVHIFGDIVEFEEEGTAKFYYYKYPERITDSTDDKKYIFELSDDALEIVPYGVAADLLKSDISNNYGKIYADRYETMLQRLDSRYSAGMIYIEVENGQW